MMKILKLKAENIKKLKAIEITPDGNVVQIRGKNAQGKTSVLDSILYALAGKKEIPSEPIRKGEDKARIELDLGEYVVERTFTDKGTYLKVTTKDGAQYPKAQEKLSDLARNIAFDPLEFSNKNSKEQVELLTELLGIDKNLQEIDQELSDAMEERKFAKRELKNAEAKVIVEKPEGKYFSMEKIDAGKVSEELEAERDKFRMIQSQRTEIASQQTAIQDQKDEIERMKKELAKMEERKAESEKKLSVLEQGYSEEKGKELKTKLENANEVNDQIELAKQYTASHDYLAEKKDEAEGLGKKVSDIREKRSELIQGAKMPIEGLSISEEGIVQYNEIPFDQLSTAERLRVSLAIAMEMNPELRVIRILDGSLLDEDNMKVIEQMVGDKDFQLWVEIVGGKEETGFYIEEGEIK